MNPASTSPTDSLTASAAQDAVATARAAAQSRNKPLAVRCIDDIEPTLGNGWSPLKHNLRAAQAAVDISRWDLVAAHLTAIENLINSHSSVEG